MTNSRTAFFLSFCLIAGQLGLASASPEEPGAGTGDSQARPILRDESAGNSERLSRIPATLSALDGLEESIARRERMVRTTTPLSDVTTDKGRVRSYPDGTIVLDVDDSRIYQSQ